MPPRQNHLVSWPFILDRAWAAFRKGTAANLKTNFERFCRDEAGWLDDYAVFMALKRAHDQRPWYQWSAGLRSQTPPAAPAATAQAGIAPQQEIPTAATTAQLFNQLFPSGVRMTAELLAESAPLSASWQSSTQTPRTTSSPWRT